jgi:hypothetical protein
MSNILSLISRQTTPSDYYKLAAAEIITKTKISDTY